MKGFRLCVKHLFLTYPNLDKGLNEVLEAIKDKLPGVINYVVCKEAHKSGEKHIHVYLELSKAHDVKSERYLDIFEVHGNYTKARNIRSSIRYLTKEGEFITSFPTYNNEIVT